MGTTDYMTDQERQDLRDAGRGHLIDGGTVLEQADEARTRAKEEGWGITDLPQISNLSCIECGAPGGVHRGDCRIAAEQNERPPQTQGDVGT